MGNTQNSVNGNNKRQMIDLNQSFMTQHPAATSTHINQLHQNSTISVSPKTALPRKKKGCQSTIVSGALLSDNKSMQSPDDTSENITKTVSNKTITNQTLQEHDSYPLSTSKSLELTTTGQLVTHQVNDNGSFVPIEKLLIVNGNMLAGEVGSLPLIEDIPILVQSPLMNTEEEIINNNPAYGNPADGTTPDVDDKRDPPYDLSDLETLGEDEEDKDLDNVSINGASNAEEGEGEGGQDSDENLVLNEQRVVHNADN